MNNAADSEKLDLLLSKIVSMESEMTSMKSELTGEMASVKNKMASMENKMASMENKMASMENKLTDVQLTLENETNKTIKIIAEGHLDLNRKLDNALKVELEKEIMLIRITTLENEVRRLKDKIEHIA